MGDQPLKFVFSIFDYIINTHPHRQAIIKKLGIKQELFFMGIHKE